jgi:DNA modification methylase
VKPMVEVAGARVFLGDCRDVVKTLPDNSVDSIVTDPPYELGFMGKKWDSSGIAYDVTVWEECLRVLKPGGHVLAFGGSRTWHRLAVAVEDAGFELRDSIAWIYGSGFPKSLNVSKAIAGHKKFGSSSKSQMRQAVMGEDYVPSLAAGSIGSERSMTGGRSSPPEITAELPPEAKEWQGWGTALKPAFEPVVVGRKPFGKGVTVAENVLAWGVGGLNIDASRIDNLTEAEKNWTPQRQHANNPMKIGGAKPGDKIAMYKPGGRWPANVILDEVTAGLLDEQSGERPGGAFPANAKIRSGEHYEGGWGPVKNAVTIKMNDTGGASRFFYVAKASKRDRNEGLEELEARIGENGNKWTDQDYRRGDEAPVTARKNFHPTVKPTQLMRYLIKLVTPEGGVVLDPFTGSGSTGKAALLDGYGFIGAELTEEYLPIIEGRLRWASEQKGEHDDTLF